MKKVVALVICFCFITLFAWAQSDEGKWISGVLRVLNGGIVEIKGATDGTAVQIPSIQIGDDGPVLSSSGGVLGIDKPTVAPLFDIAKFQPSTVLISDMEDETAWVLDGSLDANVLPSGWDTLELYTLNSILQVGNGWRPISWVVTSNFFTTGSSLDAPHPIAAQGDSAAFVPLRNTAANVVSRVIGDLYAGVEYTFTASVSVDPATFGDNGVNLAIYQQTIDDEIITTTAQEIPSGVGPEGGAIGITLTLESTANLAVNDLIQITSANGKEMLLIIDILSGTNCTAFRAQQAHTSASGLLVHPVGATVRKVTHQKVEAFTGETKAYASWALNGYETLEYVFTPLSGVSNFCLGIEFGTVADVQNIVALFTSVTISGDDSGAISIGNASIIDSDSMMGTQCLQLESESGELAVGSIGFDSPKDFSKHHFEFGIKTINLKREDVSRLQNGSSAFYGYSVPSTYIGFYTDSDNYVLLPFDVIVDEDPIDRWQKISISRGNGYRAEVGTVDWASISRIAIKIVAADGKTVTMRFDDLRAVETYPFAFLTIRSDDNRRELNAAFKKLLDGLGLKGMAAINAAHVAYDLTDSEEVGYTTTESELLRYYASGWDIVNHGNTHANIATQWDDWNNANMWTEQDYCELNPALMIDELFAPMRFFNRLGINRASNILCLGYGSTVSYLYPMTRLIRQHFKAHLMTRPLGPEPVPIVNPHHIGMLVASEHFTDYMPQENLSFIGLENNITPTRGIREGLLDLLEYKGYGQLMVHPSDWAWGWEHVSTLFIAALEEYISNGGFVVTPSEFFTYAVSTPHAPTHLNTAPQITTSLRVVSGDSEKSVKFPVMEGTTFNLTPERSGNIIIAAHDANGVIVLPKAQNCVGHDVQFVFKRTDSAAYTIKINEQDSSEGSTLAEFAASTSAGEVVIAELIPLPSPTEANEIYGVGVKWAIRQTW